MQKITNFFKYNNAFILILGALFLVAGSSFASETVRDAVIGQTIEETKGMDNSALLAANLNSLKQEMSIADVSEDETNYYVSYSFSTFDIKNNAWQNQTKNQTLKVPKDALNGGKDLGIYVQSELAQVMDGQLAYLKDSQEREQEKGVTKIIQTTKYTGLKGLILNSETKELEGYEPVVEKVERIEEPYVQPVVISPSVSLPVSVPSSTSVTETFSSSQSSSSSSAVAISSSSSSLSSSSSSSESNFATSEVLPSSQSSSSSTTEVSSSSADSSSSLASSSSSEAVSSASSSSSSEPTTVVGSSSSEASGSSSSEASSSSSSDSSP